MVIISVNVVIYQKRKTARIKSIDVEQTLLEKLNTTMTRSKEMAANNIDTFDNKWKPFIEIFRVDKHTKTVLPHW